MGHVVVVGSSYHTVSPTSFHPLFVRGEMSLFSDNATTFHRRSSICIEVERPAHWVNGKISDPDLI